MNRYLWEFYNREKGLVEYVYEERSRGQKVLKSFFDADPQTLEIILSCDGYNAYRLFDSDEYPGSHLSYAGPMRGATSSTRSRSAVRRARRCPT